MGVDPYLIAPTLKMAIAQRLARTLCSGTGTESPADQATVEQIEQIKQTLPERYRSRIPKATSVMHPEPTPVCATGYRGRTAVTEVFEITSEIQELILQNGSEEEFFTAARKNGFTTIQEDAVIKGVQHQIPYEEMMTFKTQIGTEEPLAPISDTNVNNQKILIEEQAIIESDEAITTS